MSPIIQDWIVDYLRKKQPPLSAELEQVRKQSKKQQIPVIEPEVGQLLKMLVKLKEPERILELGTAYGYSTLWLAEEFSGSIVTIEADKEAAQIARKNFTELGYNNIELRVGDALELIPKFNKNFDFIFIDAAKGQYLRFLEEGKEVLNSGGLIVADDVLFKGMIADDRFYHPRFSTLTKVLRNYIDEIMNSEQLVSTILPLGDGVAVSYKE